MNASLSRLPKELFPVAGTLHYRQVARTKLLIADLVQYLIRNATNPLYPQWRVTDEQASHIFTALHRYLHRIQMCSQLGPEVQQLVQQVSREGLVHRESLERQILQIEELPEVAQTLDRYMDARARGEVTCFFCGREVDEGGTDSSTEVGVFFACDKDWPRFGNPDEYI